jgi:16S rRNA (guanine966-N2)-methyltransferase
LRIIAGQFRSRKIVTAPGMETRPTLDRIRESLFNILGIRCVGARILDLFAGSGALGLEALSRSAKQAVFCDSSRLAALAVRTNITALGVEAATRVLQMDWQAALRQLSVENARFDIVFLDPPYKMPAARLFESIDNARIVEGEALMVLEHDRRSLPVLPGNYTVTDRRRYGDTDISFITLL